MDYTEDNNIDKGEKIIKHSQRSVNSFRKK